MEAMLKKLNKRITRETKVLTKNLPLKNASFKHWLFMAVLVVLSGMVVLSKNLNVIGIMVTITLVHFIVTKNITSALMSGAIVAVLYLLFLRYKTEELKTRENADNMEGEVEDPSVVTDNEEEVKEDEDGDRIIPVLEDSDGNKTGEVGQMYVMLPKDKKEDDDEEDDEDEEDEEEMDEEDEEMKEEAKEGFFSKKGVPKPAATCCSQPAPVKN